MDDIVNRLLAAAEKSESGGGEWGQLVHRCREAAAVITVLRAALEDIARQDWRGPKPHSIGVAEKALVAAASGRGSSDADE